MESESPLDVLSRAATMLRASTPPAKSRSSTSSNSSSSSSSSEDGSSLVARRSSPPPVSLQQSSTATSAASAPGKETSVSTRWRRERRGNMYGNNNGGSRSSTTLRAVPPLVMVSQHSRSTPHPESVAPLDMSISRRRQLDTQMVSSSSHPRGSSRITVIANGPARSPGHSSSSEPEDLGLDSDPVIDEHFRRSLGRDYVTLFPRASNAQGLQGHQQDNKGLSGSRLTSNTKQSLVASRQVAPSSDTLTGLSVDDHFAKALGDTWLRLKANEKQSEDSKSSSKTESSSEQASSASSRKSASSATVLHPPLKVST